MLGGLSLLLNLKFLLGADGSIWRLLFLRVEPRLARVQLVSPEWANFWRAGLLDPALGGALAGTCVLEALGRGGIGR